MRSLPRPALLLLALLLACGARAQQVERYYFTGTLDNDLRIQMDLTLKWSGKEAEVTGQYFYESLGIPLSLLGSADHDGNLELQETNPDGEVTGTFTGVFSSSPHEFASTLSGTWRGTDKELPFGLTKIAEYVFLEARQGRIETSSSFPFFTLGNTSVLNRYLKDKILGSQLDFFEEGQALAREGELFNGWYLDQQNAIHYVSSDLVSLLSHISSYTGGAHGNTNFVVYNLALESNGEVRVLDLRDLFLPRVNLGPLYRAVLGDLQEQEAAWVVEGSVSELSETDLALFTISPEGLSFAFAPYAMGPYVQGSFFVTVPYSRIAKLIDPQGPLARFLR